MNTIDLPALLQEIAALPSRIDGSVAPAAFLDADHTLWAADLGDAAFNVALDRKLLRAEAGPPLARLLVESGGRASGDPGTDARALYARYKAGGVSEQAIIAGQVLCYAGWTVDEVAALGDELMRGAIGGAVYEGMAEVLAALEGAGLSPHIVSGTGHWLIGSAARALGIPLARTGGALAAVDAVSGVVLGEIVEPITYQQGKIAVIDRWIGPERRAAIAFGDSVSDLPMLERSEVRVAVNPRPTLRARATATDAHRWRVWVPEKTRSGRRVERVDTDRVIV